MNGVWTAAAAVIAFAATAIVAKWGIPLLKKAKFGQNIKQEGPDTHQKKRGTPTAGGIFFIVGILCAVLIALPAYSRTLSYTPVEGMTPLSGESDLQKARIFGGLLMALAFSAVGFLDDDLRAARGRSTGLRWTQKLVLQALIAGMYLVSLYMAGENGSTQLPWIGTVSLGWFYWPLAFGLILLTVNAVNRTDGIDGLTASSVLLASIFLLLAATLLRFYGTGILAAAVAGGCAGFLIYNFHPAKVFMGDTGALFLGGLLAALGFGLGMPVLLLPVCLAFWIDAATDLVQKRGSSLPEKKRVFRMTPLHFHLELCGWCEEKIVLLFNIITLCGGAVAFVSVLLG